MKKSLMTLLTLLLVAVVALTLFACGKEEEAALKGPTTDVSKFTAKSGFASINDPLSWEDINAFDVVHEGMTIEEGRKLCVDFFRYTKTAVWTPDDNFSYFHNNEHTNALEQVGGQIYGGLPYIYVSSGNIYRLMDFMDEEKGVVDISEVTVNPHLYGNQCSIGAYWGWARVINSADYDWTQSMVEKNGFLRVGPYTYDDNALGFSNTYRTPTVIEENGEQTMFESYALLKAGDGIVYYTTAGHVVMISGDAHVVRNADGTINGDESYVHVIDQTSGWAQGQNEAGDQYTYEKNVDAKWTFTQLKKSYVPFTFKEWTGEDPIENSVTTLSYSGDTIKLDDIFGIKVTSNYGLSDIYAAVYNANGVEVYKTVSRASQAGMKELKFAKAGSTFYTWGSEENIYADQEYTVKIYAQLGTGERPVLWEGKLAH